jgi:hypothetical protein
MNSVTETLENEIEKMTGRFDALTAELVTLRSDIEDHYTWLGRQFYESRAALRTARAS